MIRWPNKHSYIECKIASQIITIPHVSSAFSGLPCRAHSSRSTAFHRQFSIQTPCYKQFVQFAHSKNKCSIALKWSTGITCIIHAGSAPPQSQLLLSAGPLILHVLHTTPELPFPSLRLTLPSLRPHLPSLPLSRRPPPPPPMSPRSDEPTP